MNQYAKIYLIPLLICMPFYVIKAQEKIEQFDTQIVYELTFKPDSNDRENIKQEYMEVLVNLEYSLFRSVYKGQNDSLSLAEQEAVESATKIIAAVGGEYTYKRPQKTDFSYDLIHKQEEMCFYEPLGFEKHFYVERLENIRDQWHLRADTMTIHGYNCQLATLQYGGRNWKAWFTSEIPMAEGPYKFKGLPGLVISIEDDKKDWIFELVAIQNIDKKEIAIKDWEKAKFKQLDKLKFYETKRYVLDNWFDIRNARFQPTYGSKEIEVSQRNAARKRAKADNNWIELY